MEEPRAHPVSATRATSARWPRAVVALGLVAALGAGCAGRYKAPRTLAGLGTFAVAAGGALWATGQALENNGNTSSVSGTGLVATGFVSVAAGLVAIVAAGGWMAAKVSCDVDPDCDENELCREIPAPPGGVPYKQCMAR
jgi:hypothetical protein